MSGRRIAGAVAGALVAGLGLSAMMLSQEKKSGKPSELPELERASIAKLGDLPPPPPDKLPDTREQAVVHGGHLLLSAVAGVAYAVATDEDAKVVPGGVAFGIAFYGLAHWLAGPALGIKRPEWTSGIGTIGMHAANHIFFGLVTASAARMARQR